MNGAPVLQNSHDDKNFYTTQKSEYVDTSSILEVVNARDNDVINKIRIVDLGEERNVDAWPF